MRVIVTRPEPDAQRWVEALARHGHRALALPLIDIHPVADKSGIRAAWSRLGNYAALMFVSRSAAEHFFAMRLPSDPVLDADTGSGTRAWATGPGTTAALLDLGVDAARIDAPANESGQFDTEALWAVVGPRVAPGDRVLIVRGADGVAGSAAGHGRDWLARRLSRAGASAEFLSTYRRAAPAFSTGQLHDARVAATDGSVWLFTSAQAVANLNNGLPDQDWGGARALATHPRIAAAARAIGFGVVWESRPGISDIVASIESNA